MDKAICALCDVRVRLGGFEFGPITHTLSRGVTSLLGANGAGKTTLMQTIVGSRKPSGGSISVGGDTKATVGFLPQDFAAPGHVRVTDYLRFIAWARSSRKSAISANRVAEALERVNLADKAHERIAHLSGGMVRRVGIAQALLTNSDVVILDEPTVGLDPINRAEVRALIHEIGADSAVLVSTHLSEDIADFNAGVLVLDEGRVLFDGTVAGLVATSGAQAVSGPGVEHAFVELVQGQRK
ncbi:ABC transporter ATP-binding protein [Rarobacter incanus]|uniref:ABC transporter family protein n=1 Tax=Rarobacter incanus TaxID=153494 RepID=A0A542SQE1_9MICO|nr:ATP-binding cassette domain-containing protein [Rarobacter incanus]TQK76831.1 ABC transporter family protein [Rarobacter incanus]